MRQSNSISFWLLALAATSGSLVSAQVPAFGKCPQVAVVKDFDLYAYMGVWYEYSKYPFIFEVGMKCIYSRYNAIDNSTISVLNKAIIRLTGNPSNVTGTAKVIEPGKLAVTFSKKQEVNKPNYLVLGTDYETFSVVYSCSSLTSLAHLNNVWILTRERQPSKETIDAAYKVLEDNKLTRSVLITTTQKNCPQLAGNGTEIASTELPDEEDFVSNALPKAIETA